MTRHTVGQKQERL